MKKILLIILGFLIIGTSFSCEKDKEYQYEVFDIFVESGKYQMPGKLTVPISDNDVAAVVMVHGSGPSDMDESIGKLKMFEDLAIGLAKNGIASIRYDKRTYTYASTIATDKYFTIYDEAIEDALSALNILKETPGIDQSNLYILGHSLGGQLAPVIASLDEDIRGVIIMGGTTMHLIDLLMEQLFAQNSPYYDEYDLWDEYFRDMDEVKSDEVGYFFGGAYMTYWVSYNNLQIMEDTVSFASNHKVLVLHGKKDLQVKYNEQEKYQEWLVDTNGIYKAYDNLNHHFVDGGNETIANAYQVAKKVPKYVTEDIANFIAT